MTTDIRRAAAAAPAIVCAVLLIAGCTAGKSANPPGAATTSGTTPIPGGPMEPLPTTNNPKIPASQQEAQDNVLKYLQMSVNALAPGSSLDGTRYVVGTGVTYCDDEPADQNSPVHVEDWRDIKLPPATDFAAVIAHMGDVWKQWGWQVLERDGFTKPNRFGYAPDGYTLQIEASADARYAPTLIGASPCFPGDLRKSDTPRNPVVISQTAPAK